MIGDETARFIRVGMPDVRVGFGNRVRLSVPVD